MLAFHDAQPPPRLADQRARAARPPLPRALGAGGQHLYRARRGAPARVRQYADPAAYRALDAACHRPHAGIVHLRDQRAPVLVRGVLREGIQRRRVLVGVFRRDRLRAHLLGGERARIRPPARRRGAARRAPLAELRELRIVDLLRGEPGDRGQLRQTRHADSHAHPALLVLPYQPRRPRHAEAVHQFEVRLELRLERLLRLHRRDPAIVRLRAVARLVLAHRPHAVCCLHDRRGLGRRTLLLIRHRHPAHLQPGLFVGLQGLPRQMAVPAIRVEENVENALGRGRAFGDGVGFFEGGEKRGEIACSGRLRVCGRDGDPRREKRRGDPGAKRALHSDTRQDRGQGQPARLRAARRTFSTRSARQPARKIAARHGSPTRSSRSTSAASATHARMPRAKPASSTNSAAMPRIARSSPGQWSPRPSPTQNAPNAERSTPTANLSVFSGILASGRCTAQPAIATSAQAASAPRLAGTSKPPTAPTASTMKTTSSPSSTTALNAVTTAIASQPRRGCAARSAAHPSANASASSCSAITPAARRIAFLSQRIPKSSSSTPTASCRYSIGMRASSGPKASTRSARKARPATVPASAGRHPRTVPTASTMVSASTASTREATKAEAIAVPAWARESMAGKCSGKDEKLR